MKEIKLRHIDFQFPHFISRNMQITGLAKVNVETEPGCSLLLSSIMFLSNVIFPLYFKKRVIVVWEVFSNYFCVIQNAKWSLLKTIHPENVPQTLQLLETQYFEFFQNLFI